MYVCAYFLKCVHVMCFMLCVHVYVCMRVHMCVFVCICVCACAYVCVRVQMFDCVYSVISEERNEEEVGHFSHFSFHC